MREAATRLAPRPALVVIVWEAGHAWSAVRRTPIERVHDQPGGADRLIARSTGVEHM